MRRVELDSSPVSPPGPCCLRLPCTWTHGSRELKDPGGAGEMEGAWYSRQVRRKGWVKGLVLQSEDLQLLTHSCVRHITLCQLL